MNKDNQKAIECLKEVREIVFKEFEHIEFNDKICNEYYKSYINCCSIADIIDNKIKELEGNDE